MKILVVGAAGNIGQAVTRLLKAEGHQVIQVGRTRGDLLMDIRDPNSLQQGFNQLGKVDAIIAAMGDVAFKPFAQLDQADWQKGIQSKLLGQIQLVQMGSQFLNAGGSFTLTSGIIADVPVKDGVSAATINGALEHFVAAVANELPQQQRINIVSPTVLTESYTAYRDYFAGFSTIDADILAKTYLRSVMGRENGRTLKAFSNAGAV
ncbi:MULTISPECIES: short chain dehydrogenase [Shewanella]|uniref:short chain dehydrogenase n=1 Tax=Shewanella TaxID=22 RepID=UPI00055AEAC0|nr:MULTISPECIES: short chain dehydrogenase [Shewanella]MCH7424992.1 short chain dehydrogenase [Shewanella sp. MM_2022_3]